MIMKIEKFNQYTNNILLESNKTQILEFLINNDGTPLVDDNSSKGVATITREDIIHIKDPKGNVYFAGVSNNGLLHLNKKNIGFKRFIWNNQEYEAKCFKIGDELVKIPPKYLSELKSVGNYPDVDGLEEWIRSFICLNNEKGYERIDYSSLIPVVNSDIKVKIDMNINKKVSKYAAPLGIKNGGSHDTFISKIKDLKETSDIKKYLVGRGASKMNIKKKMATIMLLHYIDKIKNDFNPSSSGFLFESFISGLIPNSKVTNNNKKVDIYSDEEDYQIKFVSSNNSGVTCVIDEGNFIDYYIIALKEAFSVDIFILFGFELGHLYNGLINGDIPVTDARNLFLDSSLLGERMPKISTSKLKRQIADGGEFHGHLRFNIDLLDIDKKIEMISRDLKGMIDSLYQNINGLENNIEAIITGVDEHGDIIDDSTEIYNQTSYNIDNIKIEVSRLSDKIK